MRSQYFIARVPGIIADRHAEPATRRGKHGISQFVLMLWAREYTSLSGVVVLNVLHEQVLPRALRFY